MEEFINKIVNIVSGNGYYLSKNLKPIVTSYYSNSDTLIQKDYSDLFSLSIYFSEEILLSYLGINTSKLKKFWKVDIKNISKKNFENMLTSIASYLIYIFLNPIRGNKKYVIVKKNLLASGKDIFDNDMFYKTFTSLEENKTKTTDEGFKLMDQGMLIYKIISKESRNNSSEIASKVAFSSFIAQTASIFVKATKEI